MSLNTTPMTWTSALVVTPTHMNTEIRDAVTGLQAAWPAYTPTTTGITLGNGTIAGSWNRVGKTVDFQIIFTFGSTSSITATPTFTLPATALAANWETYGTAFDTSASLWFPAPGVATSTTVVTAFAFNSTAGSNFQGVTSARPMTWATGDVLTINGRYQAA